MSLRRGVLIRILALLQRKTLNETKNRTLKCLKWHYSTVQSIKNVTVLTEDGAFTLFFRPPPRGIWQLKNPHSREFAIQGNTNANARGSAGGGGLCAGGIDWCITLSFRVLVWTIVITNGLIKFCKKIKESTQMQIPLRSCRMVKTVCKCHFST